MVLEGLLSFYEQLQGIEDSHPDSKDILVFQVLSKLNAKLQVMKNDINQTSIRSINQAAFVNLECLMPILELCLGVAVNCEQTEQIIGAFTDKLDEQTLDDLMQVTQDVLQKYGKKEDEDETCFNENENFEDDDGMGNTVLMNPQSAMVSNS